MSKQNCEIPDADTLETLIVKVARVRRRMSEVTQALQQMTGTGINPVRLADLLMSLDELRDDEVRLAVLAADALRRRGIALRKGEERT